MAQTNVSNEAVPTRVVIAKVPNSQTAEVRFVDGDKNTRAFSIEVDALTRELVVTVDPHAKNVRFTNAQISAVPARFAHKAKKSEDGIVRNWKIENGEFVTWLANGAEVTLPINDEPGPLCPTGTPEIFGQPELLFMCALGIKTGKHTLLSGPTGTGKTTIIKWIAQTLGYNFIEMPVGRSTEASHLIGEYLPTADRDNPFSWVDGPVTEAARLSQDTPTILLFDELNRIGNIAEFARIYSLLDDQRRVKLPEKRNGHAGAEVIQANDLFIFAAINPADDEGADYIGVQELDPALSSRFSYKPTVAYPTEDVEVKALMLRVSTVDEPTARTIVQAANRIRQSQEVRFPISFREMEAWALVTPYRGFVDAAEDTVVNTAPVQDRAAVRNLLALVSV